MPPIPDTFGEPIQIVTTSDGHGFELREDILAQILLDHRIRDKKVCVLSVAGAFRKGKSFLLDFLLRYLTKQVCILSMFCVCALKNIANKVWMYTALHKPINKNRVCVELQRNEITCTTQFLKAIARVIHTLQSWETFHASVFEDFIHVHVCAYRFCSINPNKDIL